MPLQTNRLVMIGLGIQGDSPPIELQPRLPDGVHLRWAFRREAGFPWHGYYLFRRPHDKRESLCVAGNWARRQPGSLPAAVWHVPEGVFQSDANLAFAAGAGQPAEIGLDLAAGSYLRFDTPAGDPAFRVDATVAFRPPPRAQRCIDVAVNLSNPRTNRFTIDNVAFEITVRGSPIPLPPPVPQVTVAVTLPVEVDRVSLDLTAGAGAGVALEALDARGQVTTRQNVDPPSGRPQTFLLAAQRPFRRFRIQYPLGRATLHRLCFSQETRAGRGVKVTAYDGDVPVGSQVLAYKPGQTATTSLSFDRITAVTISAGDAVLTELCVSPISAGATKDWQPVPNCPQPLALPITHIDYPARQGLGNAEQDWDQARTRITYIPPDPHGGDPFVALHDSFVSMHSQLKALVEGGPPGPAERAMDHPARAHTNLQGRETPTWSGEQPPEIPEVHPLDLIVLAAIHPTVAQAAGLYWADTTAEPAIAYDYLLVADHSGVSRGKAQGLLQHISVQGFGQVDAWIAFNRTAAPAQPLAAPQGVRAYALPGGTYRRADGKEHKAPGNVGLIWPLERGTQGYLRPGHPVMYHVWRDRQGNDDAPVSHGEASELATWRGPLLLVNQARIADQPARYPADWPPFALRYIDFGLEEGWYGYQAIAVDLFGRMSPKSGFAGWWQWSPSPQPKPWYFADPPAERAVHPASVRILDKMAPPPPHAVEAHVLDPDDPLLVHDKEYTDWSNALPAGAKGLVGLRVRWWWTAAQQRQAPDTAEFRLYWHAGSSLPGWEPDTKAVVAKWRDVAHWAQRFYACPIGHHLVKNLTSDEMVRVERNGEIIEVVDHRQGDQCYEVFLPIVDPVTGPGAPFAHGVPLSPSLTEPVAYANVTVTAADSAVHSTDRWRGSGPLAGRIGNESQPGTPARVYRVWRERPQPPESVPEPGRHYASAADYHSRSYFAYRWQPAAGLRVHVYRALDDSVYKLDWKVRGQRGPIDLNNPEHLRYFPPDWDASRRQSAADDLNGLSSTEGYRALSDDAKRVLAGLPGNEKAFSQITTAPLNSDTDRWPDTLDGRATNCFFYRAAYVDSAQNRSALSLASAPVFLPDVTPPKAPVITKVVAGDREIRLEWASNREPDLAEYWVYRAESEEASRDIRLMQKVGGVIETRQPADRPAQIEWLDPEVPGSTDFWYRVVAVVRVDRMSAQSQGVNVSATCQPVRARATDTVAPNPPEWVSADWITQQGEPAVRLKWVADEPGLTCAIQRRTGRTGAWSEIASFLSSTNSPLEWEYLDDRVVPGNAYEYRAVARDPAGNRSSKSSILIVPVQSF